MGDECTANNKEQCPFHGVEIERRKNTQKELEGVKEEFKDNTKLLDELRSANSRLIDKVDSIQEDFSDYKLHTSNLLTFKNVAIGCSLCGMLIISGGYFYTYDHSVESATQHNILMAKIDNAEDDISEVKTDAARTDEKYLALSNQIILANERLARIIELMNNKENKKNGG